jgi:hypothetical protein
VRDDEGPVERRERREIGDAGEEAELDGPEEEPGRDDEVEERLDDERRAERRVGGLLDPVLRQVQLDRVAPARGDERVDPDAGEVGAEDRPVRDACSRIRSTEDVLPAAHPQEEARDLEDDGEAERGPADRGESLEERLRRIEERSDVVHGLTIAPLRAGLAEPAETATAGV